MSKTYKVVICGARATGKSSLCSRLTERALNFEYVSTIGVDLMVKYFDRAKIHFWDLAGDARFENITSSYIHGVDLLIFVYNVEDFTTIDRMKYLYSTYILMGWQSPAIVVGTHNDTRSARFVNFIGRGAAFAVEHKFHHFLVNLKSNDGVSDVMDKITNILLPMMIDEEPVRDVFPRLCTDTNCILL
jgi:small GTP-binding protein